MLELNKIHQGDCLERLKEIDDNSVNLVVIDPPYNIGKDTWDKIDNYIEWFGKCITEIERVLKDNGSFYFFHNQFLTMVDIQSWMNANSKFIFKQLIVWDKWHNDIKKGNNLQGAFFKIVHNPALRCYPKMAEYCLFYTFQNGYEDKKLHLFAVNKIKKYVKDLIYKYGGNVTRANDFYCNFANKTGNYRSLFFGECQPVLYTEQQYNGLCKYAESLGCSEEIKSYKEILEMYDRKEYESRRYTFNKVSNDTSILQVPIPNIEEKEEHLTPKPVSLIKNLIEHSSNEGDIVLDCFMGSGTTAIACKELGRNFIGIEKEQKYIDMSNRRLQKLNQNFDNFTTQSHGSGNKGGKQ